MAGRSKEDTTDGSATDEKKKKNKKKKKDNQDKKARKAEKAAKKAGKAQRKAPAPVSPLAPATFPDLPEIAGAEFAAGAAGVRYAGRDDVMVVRLAPGTTVAGAFTRSATRSAPVLDCEEKLARLRGACDRGAAFVVNSGNSNAFTGASGVASVFAVTEAAAAALGVPRDCVLSSSTGVIGEPLAHDRITAALPGLAATLSPAGLPACARAIMTTDTFAKGATAELRLSGGTVRIAGIAKGSGMIAPDMATMLAYIFTDAAVPRPSLQRILSRLTDRTFNAITVDGDTSTSDTVLLAATGKGPAIGDLRGADGRAFADALEAVMRNLAWQIVRDGEGATKFVAVRVTGAADTAEARRVAMAIANSPLVKTAIAGEDANWGRIVMAVNKSGARADRDRLSISFGPVRVAENGARVPDYSEADAAAYMKGSELEIHVDLGLGKGADTVWTCDLTHRYIDINADYRS